MSSPLSATEVLDRVYLEIRCKLLDIAACLDRVARAEASERLDVVPVHLHTGLDLVARSEATDAVHPDVRLAQIAKGIDLLSSPGFDRAERIQMLFSDAYVPHWNRRETRTANGARPNN